MAYFKTPHLVTAVLSVVRKPHTFIASFSGFYGDDMENVPASIIAQLEGKAAINSYARPMQGEAFYFLGFEWEVKKISHWGYEPKSKKQKRISEMQLSYVRKCDF